MSEPRANCAFCHAQIRGADYAECSVCHTRQHTDCWDEYGGCVQPGCDGHDLMRETTPPHRARGQSRVVVAAWSILACAGLLVLAALGVKLLSGGGEPAQTAAAVPRPAQRESREERMSDQIAADLRRVFRQIDAGHWSGTLRYLADQEISDLEESGEASYIFRIAFTPHRLVGHIRPRELAVSRVHLSHSGRQAEFLLAVPRDDGRCFRGVTWARREGGHWQFDPATINRPGRESVGRQGLRNRARGC